MILERPPRPNLGTARKIEARTPLNNPIPPSPVRSAPSTDGSGPSQRSAMLKPDVANQE